VWAILLHKSTRRAILLHKSTRSEGNPTAQEILHKKSISCVTVMNQRLGSLQSITEEVSLVAVRHSKLLGYLSRWHSCLQEAQLRRRTRNDRTKNKERKIDKESRKLFFELLQIDRDRLPVVASLPYACWHHVFTFVSENKTTAL
jgi:hypothetical protein